MIYKKFQVSERVSDGRLTMIEKLENAIVEVFKIPQLITDAASLDFILDVVDFWNTDPEWEAKDPNAKRNGVATTLGVMEEKGMISSKNAKSKCRKVLDDENAPANFANLRTYSFVRNRKVQTA